MRGIEISIKAKKLILKKELCKEDCYREVNKENYYSLSIFKKPTTVTGISSRCADGLHVLFLDYDSVCKWIVEQDIMNM
ncbi:MAG: hypothetical protein U9O94_08520, partial [Nanoarchaeota archaeon]|nr:hypothetical protein [Nanoarchaeota archaeon]